ncbi:MAG: hypothetical protein ACOC71_08505 [Hyphomicrobiales bacterium]
MGTAHLEVREIDSTHYSLAFETDGGKVVCDVSVEGDAGSVKFTAAERKQAALHKAKILTRAFHEAIDG